MGCVDACVLKRAQCGASELFGGQEGDRGWGRKRFRPRSRLG